MTIKQAEKCEKDIIVIQFSTRNLFNDNLLKTVGKFAKTVILHYVKAVSVGISGKSDRLVIEIHIEHKNSSNNSKQ